jgi:aminomethyltransferase
MEHAAQASLKKTPLHSRHRASGAKLVAFAGWEMPLEYVGIVEEHRAVRERAGLFDVSHMGEIELAGRDALTALQRLASNDAARLQVGQAQYSALLTPRATFVDDMLVYRLGPQHFLLVVNAVNTDKDYAWIVEHIGSEGDVVAVDASSRYALLAVQGPAAAEALQPLTAVELRTLPPYRFAHGEVAGVRATVSRTGFTGEDGFEVFIPPQSADRVWQAILDAGRPLGLMPAGLGARDTLRLEASMRLYGNDIDETTTPLEAGLDGIVGWHKDTFNGAEVLRQQRSKGVDRKLIGFEMVDPGIARSGHEAYAGDIKIGSVTSGTHAPFLKRAVGMAYLMVGWAASGQEFEVDIRGRRVRSRVVPMPFYRRPRLS